MIGRLLKRLRRPGREMEGYRDYRDQEWIEWQTRKREAGGVP